MANVGHKAGYIKIFIQGRTHSKVMSSMMREDLSSSATTL
jgi:hypothetical protein